MVTRCTSWAYVAVVLSLTLVSTATAKYSGGTGEPNDPYQIATAADLIALGETPEDYDKHFLLTADIDLDPNLPGRKIFDKAVIAPDKEPGLYFQGTAFTGVFDGNGHTISHLTINGDRWVALFGLLGSAGSVSRLGLNAVEVSGTSQFVGGLVGMNRGGGIATSHSSGSISGQSEVGGLVGVNEGSITASHSSGSVSGTGVWFSVGGLVGSNEGRIATSYSAAVVSASGDGPQFVGGLVGVNTFVGTMTQCYSSGEVAGGASWGWVGGLAGTNYGDITSCRSTSGVSGHGCVGGLVGGNGSCSMTCSTGGVIAECYSSGAVTGRGTVGGFAGLNIGVIENCYSRGDVVGTDTAGGLVGANCASGAEWPPAMMTSGTISNCYSVGHVSGNQTAGGLVGIGPGDVISSFWNTESSQQTGSAGGEGKTTYEMQTGKTFLDAGWDFAGETANGTEDIWWILEGKDYPRFVFVWERTQARVSYPQDGAVDVPQSLVLRWRPGELAGQHDVYFGEDESAVANATPESNDIYRGRQPVEVTAWDCGILQIDEIYYWRIDEINDTDSNRPSKGRVWNFTTADFVVTSIVDDFESYNDDFAAGMVLCQTWTPGFVNGTGSFFVMAGQEIVHGGEQSMPMDYNSVTKPWYSEAERTWETPQDWTTGEADTLTLYFRGERNNSLEALYVGIEDSAWRIAVVVHPDVEAVLATEWQKWHIALGEVRAAGVDVAAVQKMVIGVGDRKNPKPGGTGRIYIDDIRLTKRMP